MTRFPSPRKRTWRKEIKEWLAKGEVRLERGHEYAASILNARFGGEPFLFNGNVPNTGLVTNLPEGACVEVPVFADRRGLNPVHVGALPAGPAVLTSLTAQVESLAVEGCLRGDPELVYQAIAQDPLTAAVSTLPEIRRMTAEMFRKNRPYLTTFKSVAL